MKVICAGMPKTGTKTLCAALRSLGYEVYDIMENSYLIADDWVKVIRDGAQIEDFRRMFKGVDAVTDVPCLFYWEELLEAFPDSKIVLTIRDEDSWYNSFVKQFDALSKDTRLILLMTICFSGWKQFRFRRAALSAFGFRGSWPWSTIKMYKEEAMRRLFRKHNRDVLQNAPKDQLLVYKVQQGWKPLCDFLRVEVPDREFPYKNKGASLMDELRREDKIMRRLDTELYVTLVVLLVFLAFVAYKLFTWYNSYGVFRN